MLCIFLVECFQLVTDNARNEQYKPNLKNAHIYDLLSCIISGKKHKCCSSIKVLGVCYTITVYRISEFQVSWRKATWLLWTLSWRLVSLFHNGTWKHRQCNDFIRPFFFLSIFIKEHSLNIDKNHLDSLTGQLFITLSPSPPPPFNFLFDATNSPHSTRVF